MPRSAMFAIDLIAIAVMVFGLYFPRHGRKDMVVAYLVVNVGVLAVADALASTGINAGLGLGLFGVLSIIRLRSAELDQEEVAYYFCALALGLLAGLTLDATWITPTLMGALLLVMFIGDHPRLYAGNTTQVLNLDRAFVDERALHQHLEDLLQATVLRTKVRRVDLVNDTTNVEVRFRPNTHSSETRSTRAGVLS